jgi:hypothetical protein
VSSSPRLRSALYELCGISACLLSSCGYWEYELSLGYMRSRVPNQYIIRGDAVLMSYS